MFLKLNNVYKFIFIIFTMIGYSMTANANDNILLLELKDGIVSIELKPDAAPNHVSRIKELVNEGFYDGLKFHRVIAGFMAQTGDPQGNGTGGSGTNLKAEFNNERHLRGTLSMARAQDPNSADSQFFICLEDAPHLNGQYTVWGQVIDGMEYVDNIKKGEGNNGAIIGEPDIIVSMKMKNSI
jgi:peptidylprolyl isomerase